MIKEIGVLYEELQLRNVRTVNVALLLDFEVAHEASVGRFFDGDQTVTFADLGVGGGCTHS